MTFEVALAANKTDLLLRDSQDREGPTLAFSRAEWLSFVQRIKEKTPVFEKVNAFETPYGPKLDAKSGLEHTVLFSLSVPWSTSVKLYFTGPEVDTFVAEVREGGFDPENLAQYVPEKGWKVAEPQ